jgi:hypothetical protein
VDEWVKAGGAASAQSKVKEGRNPK